MQIPNGWSPRPYQKKAWNFLEGGGKRVALVCHRRWGKDDLALHWTATQLVTKPGTYWHMLPEASQARKAIWLAVNPHTGKRRIDEAFPPEIRARTNDQEMFIETVNGSYWHVVGSDNFNSLVGSPPAGIVFSEWALANPAAWAYLEPILNENGGWAAFIYTARGRNHGYSLYRLAQDLDSWHAELQTVDDTGVFTPEALDESLKSMVAIYGKDEGKALFNQEYYCSFESPILGAYYADAFDKIERENRIGRVRHEPGVPVHTSFDLGHTDSTSIWMFQVIHREIRVIDYYESAGKSIDHYVRELQSKPYVYGSHLLPHDAFDSRYKLATGKTLADSIRKLGLQRLVQVPQLEINAGINQARLLLDRCWFDAEKCDRGIEALRQYRREWNDKMRDFRARPLHDWTSHGADAFRYLAVGIDYVSRGLQSVVKPRTSRARDFINKLSHIV